MMPMTPPEFVLDTNVFVTAKNGYYAFDICPSFWHSILTAIQNGQVVVIDRVLDEILAGNDELTNWMRAHVSELSVSSSDDFVRAAYSQMVTWVLQNQQFTDAAKAEFTGVADGWIAAYASAHNATVVTLEIFDAGIERKVKLPNICVNSMSIASIPLKCFAD